MKISYWCGCVGGALLAFGWATSACSAGGPENEAGNPSGGSGGSAGTINPTGGSSGLGTGGGSGGTINPTGGASGAGGVPDDAGCTGVSEEAENRVQPADIVIIVDNSGSMTFEAGAVQQHMNNFAQAIIAANIDPRVTLISAGSDGDNGICIPPPLGSGTCPNDTALPVYKRIDRGVGSNNPLQLLLELFPQYQDMLRTGATKHFIAVTDDESDINAQEFDTQIRPLLQGLDPAFQKYTFHGIYAFTGPFAGGTPCFDITFQKAAAEGTVYRALVQMTGGAQGDLCLQDFAPVFAAVSQNVIQGSGLACEWVIPPPPNGGTLDKNKVNVSYTPTGGAPQPIGYVSDPSQCPNVQNGWYYDNAANPTKVLACPNTCSVIQQGGAGAKIDITFGCEQIVAVPR
jgi:hypothetical protein